MPSSMTDDDFNVEMELGALMTVVTAVLRTHPDPAAVRTQVHLLVGGAQVYALSAGSVPSADVHPMWTALQKYLAVLAEPRGDSESPESDQPDSGPGGA